MLKRMLLIFAIFWSLQLLIISCKSPKNRQQHCKGKYVSGSIYVGKGIPAYHDIQNYEIVPFDSITFLNNLTIQTFDCKLAKNFSFINSAYAFAYIPPLTTMVHAIDSISYSTLRNYNSTHPAGSNINDILHHQLDNTKDWTGLGSTISKIVSDINLRYNKEMNAFPPYYYSRLSEKPSLNMDTVQIAVKFYMQNGIVFDAQTQPFILKY